MRLTVSAKMLRWRGGLVLRGLEALPVAFGRYGRSGVGRIGIKIRGSP
jgi:hypothetical protein